MREIKFRLIKDGKIVGYEKHYLYETSPRYEGKPYKEVQILLADIDGPMIGEYEEISTSDDDGMGESHMIDCDMKRQYIGRHDKVGVEIYDGDVVEHWQEEMFFKGNVRGVVEWSDSCQWFEISYESNSQAMGVLDPDYCQYKVIGNIDENPELLEIES